MKYTFGVNSSTFDEIEKISEDITKNFQSLTGGKEEIRIGFRIMGFTVETDKKLDEKSIERIKYVAKKKLSTINLLKDRKVWVEVEKCEK